MPETTLSTGFSDYGGIAGGCQQMPFLTGPDTPLAVYRRLRRRFGHAGWWPARSRFEVCLGAILTQNTAWTNVEKALRSLRRRGWLSYRALRSLPGSRLATALRPAGTYRVKARRVAAF